MSDATVELGPKGPLKIKLWHLAAAVAWSAMVLGVARGLFDVAGVAEAGGFLFFVVPLPFLSVGFVVGLAIAIKWWFGMAQDLKDWEERRGGASRPFAQGLMLLGVLMIFGGACVVPWIAVTVLRSGYAWFVHNVG